MAIIADYAPKGLTKAYISIDRIWGSTAEGWNAWVSIYGNPQSSYVVDTIHLHTDFVDDNPFPLLYARLKELAHFSNIEDHLVAREIKAIEDIPSQPKSPVELEAESLVVEENNTQPTKGRKKKSAD